MPAETPVDAPAPGLPVRRRRQVLPRGGPRPGPDAPAPQDLPAPAPQDGPHRLRQDLPAPAPQDLPGRLLRPLTVGMPRHARSVRTPRRRSFPIGNSTRGPSGDRRRRRPDRPSPDPADPASCRRWLHHRGSGGSRRRGSGSRCPGDAAPRPSCPPRRPARRRKVSRTCQPDAPAAGHQPDPSQAAQPETSPT